jgi:uncharacterized protein YecE (DUF72 family)
VAQPLTCPDRMATGKIWLGISNGQLPGNKSTFPPAYQSKSRLHYYASLFNTIEVNSTFYKIPQRKTLEKWVDDVPEDFRFTLKLNREVTHAKELKYDETIIEKFMQAADGIGEKKGCLLIQFPGKITVEYFSQVEQILGQVKVYDPEEKWQIAVEFRHQSWYIRETTELMNEHNAAIVLHDLPKGRLETVAHHAPFAFIRFHGPEQGYRGSYTQDWLDKKAAFMHEQVAAGKEVYAYFNNTAGGAFENARYLQQRTRQ